MRGLLCLVGNFHESSGKPFAIISGDASPNRMNNAEELLNSLRVSHILPSVTVIGVDAFTSTHRLRLSQVIGTMLEFESTSNKC